MTEQTGLVVRRAKECDCTAFCRPGGCSIGTLAGIHGPSVFEPCSHGSTVAQVVGAGELPEPLRYVPGDCKWLAELEDDFEVERTQAMEGKTAPTKSIEWADGYVEGLKRATFMVERHYKAAASRACVVAEGVSQDELDMLLEICADAGGTTTKERHRKSAGTLLAKLKGGGDEPHS